MCEKMRQERWLRKREEKSKKKINQNKLTVVEHRGPAEPRDRQHVDPVVAHPVRRRGVEQKVDRLSGRRDDAGDGALGLALGLPAATAGERLLGPLLGLGRLGLGDQLDHFFFGGAFGLVEGDARSSSLSRCVR
mgnify:CR=1 FL=1